MQEKPDMINLFRKNLILPFRARGEVNLRDKIGSFGEEYTVIWVKKDNVALSGEKITCPFRAKR